MKFFSEQINTKWCFSATFIYKACNSMELVYVIFGENKFKIAIHVQRNKTLICKQMQMRLHYYYMHHLITNSITLK